MKKSSSYYDLSQNSFWKHHSTVVWKMQQLIAVNYLSRRSTVDCNLHNLNNMLRIHDNIDSLWFSVEMLIKIEPKYI